MPPLRPSQAANRFSRSRRRLDGGSASYVGKAAGNESALNAPKHSVHWGKMTMSSTGLVSLEEALSGEHSALLSDILRDEGIIPDSDPEINLRDFGLHEFRPRTIVVEEPLWLKRTKKFFEFAKSKGLLDEARALWLKLGRPIYDRECKQFKALVCWLRETIMARQLQERQANCDFGVLYSAPSGKTVPWTRSSSTALSGWSRSFFLPAGAP